MLEPSRAFAIDRCVSHLASNLVARFSQKSVPIGNRWIQWLSRSVSVRSRNARAKLRQMHSLNWRVYLTLPFKCSARSRGADVRGDLKPVSHSPPLRDRTERAT